MTNQTLPSRFKRVHFDAVSHIIGAALRAYPEAIEVDPKPLSLETMARKLREAVEAKRLYGYQTPCINDSLFDMHSVELGTSMRDDGTLWFGTAEAIREKKVQKSQAGELKQPDSDITVELPLLHLEVFLSFVNAGSIKGLTCVILGIDQKSAEYLEQRYPNIGLLEEGDKKWRLV